MFTNDQLFLLLLKHKMLIGSSQIMQDMFYTNLNYVILNDNVIVNIKNAKQK